MAAERESSQGAERLEQARAELEAARQEKLEQLQRVETEPDNAEQRAEAAREVINKQEQAPTPPPAPEATPRAPISWPRLNPKLNYAQTMASMQRQLSPLSRSFSKVIHAPIVEKTSEALENTVARPSLNVGATWTALIVGAVFYFTARHFGYTLSGSELLFSFIVGAALGLLGEGVWRALRRR